jgi:hypothetical protein
MSVSTLTRHDRVTLQAIEVLATLPLSRQRRGRPMTTTSGNDPEPSLISTLTGIGRSVGLLEGRMGELSAGIKSVESLVSVAEQRRREDRLEAKEQFLEIKGELGAHNLRLVSLETRETRTTFRLERRHKLFGLAATVCGAVAAAATYASGHWPF